MLGKHFYSGGPFVLIIMIAKKQRRYLVLASQHTDDGGGDDSDHNDDACNHVWHGDSYGPLVHERLRQK